MTNLILCTLYITNVYILYTYKYNCQYDRFKYLHVPRYIQLICNYTCTNRTLVLWTSSIVCTCTIIVGGKSIHQWTLQKIGSIYNRLAFYVS